MATKKHRIDGDTAKKLKQFEVDMENVMQTDDREKRFLRIVEMCVNFIASTGATEQLKKSFSEWETDRVMQFFGVSSSKDYADSKLVPDPVQKLPSKVVAPLQQQIDICWKFTKGFFGKSEAARVKMLNTILMNLAIPLFQEHVYNVDEGWLDSEIAGGRVEFVMYAYGVVIMHVLEAKKDQIEAGEAQLMMELFSASLMNRSKGFEMPVVGAVSTVTKTHVLVYFPRENKFARGPAVDVPGFGSSDLRNSGLVETLAGALLSAFDYASQVVLPMIAKHQKASPELQKKAQLALKSREAAFKDPHKDDYATLEKWVNELPNAESYGTLFHISASGVLSSKT